MTRKKILRIFGIIILILVCVGVGVWSIFYIEKSDNLETHTVKQIKSKSLDGNYTFDTSSPYFSSEISIASSTDTYVNYDINTSSFAHTGNLTGVAFKDMSTTSLTYVSRDYHQGEAQEGCKIIITFLDDAHVTYNATDESVDRDDYVNDCNGYHGAHGKFFDGDIHVKGDKVNLPTLVNLGFTEEDRLMFKKIANNNDISVEDFIYTTYDAEGTTPVTAEKKIIDEKRPHALIYSIQSANIYNGMETCLFSSKGGYCNYGLFMKDKGNYYVITGSNGGMFTYATTNKGMLKIVPESFKKELESQGIDETMVSLYDSISPSGLPVRLSFETLPDSFDMNGCLGSGYVSTANTKNVTILCLSSTDTKGANIFINLTLHNKKRNLNYEVHVDFGRNSYTLNDFLFYQSLVTTLVPVFQNKK